MPSNHSPFSIDGIFTVVQAIRGDARMADASQPDLLLLCILQLVAASAIGAGVLLLLSKLTKARSLYSGAVPPGSTGLPLLGETPAFLAAHSSGRGFYDFVKKRRSRYGNCFRTAIFGETQVFVSSADAAKAILGSDGSAEFSKKYMKSTAELLGAESLLCASHDHHRFLRRGISTLFSPELTGVFAAKFDKLVVDLLLEWEHRNSDIVVLDDVMKITFKAICAMLISVEDEDELRKLQGDVSTVTAAMLALPLKLPGTRFWRGLQARKRIICKLRRAMSSRRNGSHHPEDLLQQILDGETLITEEQIADNILTLIIAGQVTTASAMTWMVKYLDKEKDIQQELRKAQMEFARKNPQQPLQIEELNRMHYANQIVKETLRMATVVTWFPRVALKDCDIAGFKIQKGWTVNVDARSIHYDAAVYDDPDDFRPSRFNDDPKPYSLLAFGAGGRTCLGMNLARVMMLLFLHRLVTTYRWEVTDQDSSLKKCAMFPTPRNGCPIRVTKPTA